MEIKVKDLGSIDEKSMAQKEEAVLDKAANNTETAEQIEAPVVSQEEATQVTQPGDFRFEIRPSLIKLRIDDRRQRGREVNMKMPKSLSVA